MHLLSVCFSKKGSLHWVGANSGEIHHWSRTQWSQDGLLDMEEQS